MERLSTTPFGARRLSVRHLAGAIRIDEMASRGAIAGRDKWDLLADLREARAAFGISDRDLAVLHAMLSFHPDRRLEGQGPLVVFPSNKTLMARAHGMAESTLRRHVARLVDTGLILRHDSPNGKRYAVRGRAGQITRAFGFDLSPLLARADEIAAAVEQTRLVAEQIQTLRDAISVKIRDIDMLSGALEDTEQERDRVPENAGNAKEIRKILRRRQTVEQLQDLLRRTEALERALLHKIDVGGMLKTEESSASPAGYERHNDRINHKETSVDPHRNTEGESDACSEISLDHVRTQCPDISLYGERPVRDWADLERRADAVSGMLGISATGWRDAKRALGYRQAAIVLAWILQHAERIRSPGGYLTILSRSSRNKGMSLKKLLESCPQTRASGAVKKLTAVNSCGVGTEACGMLPPGHKTVFFD